MPVSFFVTCSGLIPFKAVLSEAGNFLLLPKPTLLYSRGLL